MRTVDEDDEEEHSEATYPIDMQDYEREMDMDKNRTAEFFKRNCDDNQNDYKGEFYNIQEQNEAYEIPNAREIEEIMKVVNDNRYKQEANEYVQPDVSIQLRNDLNDMNKRMLDLTYKVPEIGNNVNNEHTNAQNEFGETGLSYPYPDSNDMAKRQELTDLNANTFAQYENNDTRNFYRLEDYGQSENYTGYSNNYRNGDENVNNSETKIRYDEELNNQNQTNANQNIQYNIQENQKVTTQERVEKEPTYYRTYEEYNINNEVRNPRVIEHVNQSNQEYVQNQVYHQQHNNYVEQKYQPIVIKRDSYQQETRNPSVVYQKETIQYQPAPQQVHVQRYSIQSDSQPQKIIIQRDNYQNDSRPQQVEVQRYNFQSDPRFQSNIPLSESLMRPVPVENKENSEKTVQQSNQIKYEVKRRVVVARNSLDRAEPNTTTYAPSHFNTQGYMRTSGHQNSYPSFTKQYNQVNNEDSDYEEPVYYGA